MTGLFHKCCTFSSTPLVLWRDETNLDFQRKKTKSLIKSVWIISLLPSVQWNLWSKLSLKRKKNPYHNCSHLHKWSMVGQFAWKGVAIYSWLMWSSRLLPVSRVTLYGRRNAIHFIRLLISLSTAVWLSLFPLTFS